MFPVLKKKFPYGYQTMQGQEQEAQALRGTSQHNTGRRGASQGLLPSEAILGGLMQQRS